MRASAGRRAHFHDESLSKKKGSLRYVDAADVWHGPEQRGGHTDTSNVNVVRPAHTYYQRSV